MRRWHRRTDLVHDVGALNARICIGLDQEIGDAQARRQLQQIMRLTGAGQDVKGQRAVGRVDVFNDLALLKAHVGLIGQRCRAGGGIGCETQSPDR